MHSIGSVSTGTMRTEDLIPTFIDELKRQKPLARRHRKLVREIEKRMCDEDYFNAADADEDLESMFDALNEYAPAYFYFGVWRWLRLWLLAGFYVPCRRL